ncbi:hypothetical protein [Trinickia sp. EG282A]|uniref:hypothetical protein n=1 Tax=Trinickia sp. EG282A TaxID=3237013 RepID=UPI0034D25903
MSSRASTDDPYCEFTDDRERRHALVSRDLRIVGCRMVTVVGVVVLVLYSPPGSMVALIVRLLGRL